MRALLITLLLLAVSGVCQAEKPGFLEHVKKGQAHEMARIYQLRHSLRAAFGSQNDQLASNLTAVVTDQGNQIAMATLVESERGIWVLPAEGTVGKSLEFSLVGGSHIWNATPKLLSKKDNLALVETGRVDCEIRQGDLNTGSFVGSRLGGTKWKTGTVSTLPRMAASLNPILQSQLLKHWKNIGLKVSKIRSGFPEVVGTDLKINPDDEGIGVFNLKSELVGVAISRADHHVTYVIPMDRINNLINS